MCKHTGSHIHFSLEACSLSHDLWLLGHFRLRRGSGRGNGGMSGRDSKENHWSCMHFSSERSKRLSVSVLGCVHTWHECVIFKHYCESVSCFPLHTVYLLDLATSCVYSLGFQLHSLVIPVWKSLLKAVSPTALTCDRPWRTL